MTSDRPGVPATFTHGRSHPGWRRGPGDVLTRELEGVASEHAQELSAVVPGFGAALAWPDAESPQLPC